MTPDIENYHQTFAKYPRCLIEDKGVISGFWWIGNNYKRKNGYYGEYPPSYLDRVRALYPSATRTLHMFSGSIEALPGECTCDSNLALCPDCGCPAEEVGLELEGMDFDLILADPPYSPGDAKRYGQPYPNKRIVLRELRRTCAPGAALVWLDTQVPMFRKIDWRLVGTIGLFTGTNRRIRAISLFSANSE
jgi:hypothetical protein